uniref:Tudor domain-containing protein 1 n=2 Tax=Monopterus albus TaxID=43700 RepID=A0A3Q3KD09_MONAL
MQLRMLYIFVFLYFIYFVRPNLPLRKPSSSPVAFPTAKPSTRHVAVNATVMRSSSGTMVQDPVHSPLSRDNSAVVGFMPPVLNVYLCKFCGQQGNFRCKRCKKMPYCSVVCQTEDWKEHRHVCKAIDPEPAKEKPNETTLTGERAELLKQGDPSTPPRVYLKDLDMTKIITRTGIQASVLEFYSPSRFFILVQSPEVLEALQSISAELQKTYSCPSVMTYVPCVGEVCGVQYSCDLKWYRGLVQTFAADQKMANILYIDFGNEEDVPVNRIRPLTNIKPFCPCAVECCIAGVVPVAGKWSGKCCIAVRQLLAGKTVTVRLVEMAENGRVHAVDILLSMGNQLSTLLIENGYAAKKIINTTLTEQEITAMMSASLENFQHLSTGEDDNSWAQPPQPLTQAVGDSFFVVITHFQSPDKMIVQKVENARLIHELQLKLREHCRQVPPPQNFRPAPGTICCALFSEDKQWYRAKVLAYSSENRVCVVYLDFGNSEEVDLDHLWPISTSLLVLPMQAIPCVLAGVQPVGERWSEDCLLALQQRVLNRILRINIQGALEGRALVAMIDESSDPQADVAELLISAGYAVPSPVTAISDQQAEQTMTAAAVQPPVPVPVNEPVVWSYADLSCDGQTVALLVNVVENPGEFYCHINSPTDRQQLIELGTELNKHCEADASPFEPKVGEPCCALSSDIGVWYRAIVKELSEDKVSVIFVDYGMTMKVERSHLRSITPRLLAQPFQAVRCWLTGVEPLGSEWSSEAVVWFQTLVLGRQLSARVLSITEQGYGVELESRGQNVAAALISEQLAKVPREISKETQETTACRAKYPESAKDNELSQIQPQASNQTGASSKEMPTEQLAASPSEVPSFPVDWKTVELPLSESFKPYIAAVTSPSLFYLFVPSQVQQKLLEVMMEVAVYCSNNSASSSSAVLSRPAPGAACCAQYSADNSWYRAVVLEAAENEMSVIYADYGNTEKVPLSRILPIPMRLLHFPFQIIRCTLSGKEHFPAEWPEEVQQMFQSILLSGVLATVQSFDGFANVLSLTLPTERGGGHLTPMILDALQAQTQSNLCPATTQRANQADSCTPPASITAAPEPTPQTPQQNEDTYALAASEDSDKKIPQMEPLSQNNVTNGPQSISCCCLCQTKIDHLEEMMKLQLTLITHLVEQTK